MAEIETGLATAKSEAAASGQKMTEKREALEKELARLSQEHEQEKRDLEKRIHAERFNREALQDTFQKVRDDHKSSYRAAYDGPSQQICSLEGAISEIQRNSDAELNSLRQRSEKLRQRIDETESEIQRVQAKLEQTEHEVQEGTARVTQSKTNHRTAKESLERERNLKQEELQRVQRSVNQKSEQLKAISRAGEDERRRLLREVEEAKHAKARQLGEADHRLQSLRSEYSTALEDTGSYGAGRFDPPYRIHANDNHIQELGSQMQKSLASMENRAARLRH
jgi:chromosome segregation ATPase